MAPNLIHKEGEYYVAITGHRPEKLGHDYDLTSMWMQRIEMRVYHELKSLIADHKKVIPITGMAQGIDTLFALLAIRLNLSFVAAIPCHNQHRLWPMKSQQRYKKILANPLCEVVMVNNGAYYYECMQDRNIWMVNNCNTLIAIHDGSTGGTNNCIEYAKDVKKPIIKINPLLLKT